MLYLLALFCLSAQAHQSDPQFVEYDDTVVVFEDITIDSGWLPATGPIGLRFEFLSNGGAELSGEGEANLSWDDSGGWLGFEPKDDSGVFAITTALEFLVSIRFDINFWSWEGPLLSEAIVFEAEEEHTPFLLEDEDPNRLELSADAAGIMLYDFVLEVIPSVADVGFYLELEPQIDVGAEGIGWILEDQLIEDSVSELSVELAGASVDFSPSYVAAFDAQLDLSINPIVEVCVLVICTDWNPVEFPVEVITEQQEHIFPSSDVTFPLPVISLETTTIDLGTIEVGETILAELPISNDGLWYLDGSTILFGGDGAVSVYPDQIFAAPESTDGLSVQLSPLVAGPIEAVLQITNNDPVTPIIEVIIVANAVEPNIPEESVEEAELDNGKVGMPVSGCSCSQSHTPSASWLFALMPFWALIFWRRTQ